MEIVGNCWRDAEGRRLILRGVNLGGDCKVPARPDGWTGERRGFYGRDVSFVGRPFPLDRAEEHLGRLKRWGMDFLRLVVTWEAVEHAAPGVYDLEYLDYLEAVIAKAGDMGFSVYVDPHQDVWSRWTGGDGAPLWTLEAVGFKPELL
ncbi:MAG: cellulase family glycosylhydrolase, partial [Spirochaetaceae bacterium]|nr:cellulase family glycosylhydrolase [Spirochaetaceae bacterium]